MGKQVMRQMRNGQVTLSKKSDHALRKTEENGLDNDAASLVKAPNLSNVIHSPGSVLQLQRLLGNQSVIHLLREQPEKPARNQNHALTLPPLDTDVRDNHRTTIIQRSIALLPGKSSGWFGKGRRDTINEMVTAYNILEKQTVGAKLSIAGIQALITEIQKIWQAASAWQLDVLKDKPQKGEEILTWIKTQVEPEEDAKKAQLGGMQKEAALKAAWEGASYNVLYTTQEYTDYNKGAGVRWLQTPAIELIYRYHLIKNQFEGVTLDAYDDVTRYKQNPSRAEALRIYQKYDMGTASKLNITGEGAGGKEAIDAVRGQITALEADPTAAVPRDFGAIEKSLVNVINEMFISFRSTEPFKKVTTPPK